MLIKIEVNKLYGRVALHTAHVHVPSNNPPPLIFNDFGQ